MIKQAVAHSSDGDAYLAMCCTPQEIVTYLNAALAPSPHQVMLSATRWTAKNSLVVTAEPNTTEYHLLSASHFLTDTLTPCISMSPSAHIPLSAKENVKWSCLLINGIPTGVTPSHGAYKPSECHDALAVNNPIYHTL